MQFLQFASLQNISGLCHAVTTRNGSGGPYNALNLAYHVGDDAEHVSENRRRLAEKLGYDATRLIAAQQVHGVRSQIVTEADAGCGAFAWDSALPDCDAIIVQASQIPVLIQVADCAPLLVVDTRNHVLSVIHVGWRGAAEEVTSRTLAQMESAFGTNGAGVKIGAGPCLCNDCFEIGVEVADAASEMAPEAVLRRGEWHKPHLDLRLLLRSDLEKFGVLPQNIEVMPHCPRCQNDLLFSHRGQNGTAGRFGIVAWWEN